MILDITITTSSIITYGISIIVLILSTFVTVKVSNYINTREIEERQKMEMQKLHNMKLEAMIYAVLSFGPHKDEIRLAYEKKLKESLKDEQFIKEMSK